MQSILPPSAACSTGFILQVILARPLCQTWDGDEEKDRGRPVVSYLEKKRGRDERVEKPRTCQKTNFKVQMLIFPF